MRLIICSVLLFCITPSLRAQQDSLLIGPGDELHVQVFDTPELEEVARVSDQGSLPLVLGGSIKVAEMTPEEAGVAIQKVLVDARIMYSPRVLVTVRGYATQNVTVFGQVARPGAYEIDTPRSIFDVLTLAGGLTDLADRHITIERRDGRPQEKVFVSNDSTDAFKRNTIVYPGDTLFVPKTGIVYVLGAVGRPGGYPMTDNDSTLTVLQAVAMAGGTSTAAVPSHARLIHRTRGEVNATVQLPLGAMQKGNKPDLPMLAGDIVYVPFSYLRNAALGLTGIMAAATSSAIYVH